ncbi:MAG: hypothetical protein ABR591_06650 [Candidatus Velthaea sp.]
MNGTPEEPSATDDRIAENRTPAPVAPATRDPQATEPSGLPPGQSDDRRSPLDPVFYDPQEKKPS